MRIGIYGGSFNPIHMAHLMLAECCREQLRLDRVMLIPAGRPPNKPGCPLMASEDRLAMVELAVAGYPEYVVSREEIDRARRNDAPGWTTITVRNLRQEYELRHPGEPQEWFLLMGMDMFLTLPQWYEAAELLRMVMPIGVSRPGYPASDTARLFEPLVGTERAAEISAAQRVVMPQMDISGTEIRQRIAAGQSIRWRVPAAVEAWLQEHRPVISEKTPCCDETRSS